MKKPPAAMKKPAAKKPAAAKKQHEDVVSDDDPAAEDVVADDDGDDDDDAFDDELASRIAMVQAALAKEEYELEPQVVHTLNLVLPFALSVPLDDRQPFQDEVVTEAEIIFWKLEKKVSKDKENMLDAARALQGEMDSAAEFVQVATNKLAEAEATVVACQHSLKAADAAVNPLKTISVRAKKVEAKVEAAKRAAEYLQNRPRRSSAASPRSRALEQAQEALEEAKAKELEEKKKEQEEDEKAGISAAEHDAKYKEAIQAQAVAFKDLEGARKNRGAMGKLYETAKEDFAAFPGKTQAMRVKYKELEERAVEFYKDYSAFRVVQCRLSTNDFEPPQDFSPPKRDDESRPKFLDTPASSRSPLRRPRRHQPPFDLNKYKGKAKEDPLMKADDFSKYKGKAKSSAWIVPDDNMEVDG